MAEEKKMESADYLLQRRYLSGTRRYERGDVVSFLEGKAPRTAQKLTKAEAKRLKGQGIEAATDPLAEQLAALQAEVEELKADKKPAPTPARPASAKTS